MNLGISHISEKVRKYKGIFEEIRNLDKKKMNMKEKKLPQKNYILCNDFGTGWALITQPP